MYKLNTKNMKKSTKQQNDLNFNLELIFELEKQGKNLKEISEILNIKKETLGFRLKKLNIKLKTNRSKFFKNHEYFDIIDNEKKAYLLGFIVADGCITEAKTKIGGVCKSLTLNNSIDDLEIIELLNYEIFNNSNNLKFTEKSVYRKKQCRFKVTSYHMIDTLINVYNITPKKTLDLNFQFPFEKIPQNLQKHFVRGFFDGDGCISKYTKTITKRFSLVFTSEIFMYQINNILKKEIPEISITINKKIGKTINYYITNISLGGNKLEKMYNYLYDDSTIFLKKKKQKFNLQNTVLN